MTTTNKIQELESMMDSIKARLDHVEQVLNIESPFAPDSEWEKDISDIDEATMSTGDVAEMDEMIDGVHIPEVNYPGMQDDATLGANDIEHSHEDGTTHSHPGGAEPHEHDIDTTDLDHSTAAAYDTLPSDVEPSPEGK